MVKIFELLKEIFYDILGYIVPGFFIFLLACLVYVHGNFATPMYSLIYNHNDLNRFINCAFIYIDKHLLIVMIISYLLGHLPKYISLYLKNNKIKNCIVKDLLKLEKKVDSNFCYLKPLSELAYSKVDSELKNTFQTNECFSKFINTYASTLSRFNNSNDLIQKYIAKVNFYNSFSTIFFIVTLDYLISLIIYIFKYKLFNINFIFPALLCFIILLLLFNAFYYEYYKHIQLREKEAHLFIYNHYSNIKIKEKLN